MIYLKYIVQLNSFEVFQDDIDRVLGFVDSIEFHNVVVVDASH